MKKHNFLIFTLILVASFIFSACGQTTIDSDESDSSLTTTEDGLSGTLSISGAFALYPMMTVWADEFTKIHSNVQFDVQGGGAGKGMTDTIAGAVDIGMISRSIKPEEEAQGIFWVSVTKDAVFPIINAENPVVEQIMEQGLTQEVFNKIYITGEITTWGEVIGDPTITDTINVFTRADAAGAADQWALYSGGAAQEDLLGIGIHGEPSIIDTITKDPIGIGYGNLNSIFDLSSGQLVPGIVIPPLDINESGTADASEIYDVKEKAFDAVAIGIYPSPPARFENLATLGKPEGITMAFIEWILTDGQQYLESAGYIPLTIEQQTESLDKIK